VEAHDLANTAGVTFRIDSPFLNRNGKGIAASTAGIDSLAVLAGNGPNTFAVERTKAGIPVALIGGAGTDAYRIAPTFRILNAIAGVVTVSGGGGSDDSLTLIDAVNAAAAIFTLDATSVQRQMGAAMARVNYSGVEDMSLLAGTGNDLLTVAAAPSAGDVLFAAGGGSNTLAGGEGNVFTRTGTNTAPLRSPPPRPA
jgi:hypothetical protein